MYSIMTTVYDGVDRDDFEADLAAKDDVILLRDPSGTTVGFSTQRVVKIEVDGRSIIGVFSGDTVIDPAHWGSPALFQTFARRYIVERPDPWYWFLISKGHRTYRMLPTFFTTFWPTRRLATPGFEKSIMDAYATALYGDDYDQPTGVLAYAKQKDRLREGVAGITEQTLRNPDAAFFAAVNPGHVLGHDLVCLTELSPANLRPQLRPRLLGDA